MARDRTLDRALGAVIKRRREMPPSGAPRLTQRELGEAVGFAQGKAAAVAISRIESGAVRVAPDRLTRIARILDTTSQALREEAEASLLADLREDALASATGATTGLTGVVRRAMGGHAAVENLRLRSVIEQEVAVRQEKTGLLLERLGDSQQELIDRVLMPFMELASQVGWPDRPDERPTLELGDQDQTLNGLYEAHNRALRWEVLDTLGSSALGAGAGAAMGGGAAALLVTWVAASATASTGAAIGSLSGAAATSATLAWFGGGSLAAGGLGVAGGAAVLAGIVTLPALIAAGGVFAYQRKRIQREAIEESVRILEAQEALKSSSAVLNKVWTWLDREREVVDGLTTLGLRDIRWLRRLIDEAGPIAYADLDGDKSTRLDGITDLVVTSTAVLGLPVLRDLDLDAADDPTKEDRWNWNELVLEDAERFVAEGQEDERLRRKVSAT